MARVSVNDVSLAVHCEGEGDAVLLLHGVPDSAMLWRKVTPALVSAGYRVVSLDQRGSAIRTRRAAPSITRCPTWPKTRSLCTQHAEAERWVRDLSRPGRLTAALNWYRANSLSVTDHPNVTIPVLAVWSDGDFALTEAQMTGSAKYVDGPWRYERIEGASHWLPLDAPDRAAGLLLEFFEQHRERRDLNHGADGSTAG